MIDPNLINTQNINFFLQFPFPHLTFDSVYRYGISQTKPKQNNIYIQYEVNIYKYFKSSFKNKHSNTQLFKI